MKKRGDIGCSKIPSSARLNTDFKGHITPFSFYNRKRNWHKIFFSPRKIGLLSKIFKMRVYNSHYLSAFTNSLLCIKMATVQSKTLYIVRPAPRCRLSLTERRPCPTGKTLGPSYVAKLYCGEIKVEILAHLDWSFRPDASCLARYFWVELEPTI